MRSPASWPPTASGPFQRAPSTPLRLEKNGLVSAAFRPSELGPKRKYYSLTPAGEAELQQFIQNYAELSHAVGNLLSALKGDADHE